MLIKCKMCGSEFDHNKRGKRPTICKKCKNPPKKHEEIICNNEYDLAKRTLYSIVNSEGFLLSTCKFENENRARKFAGYLNCKNFSIKKEVKEILIWQFPGNLI